MTTDDFPGSAALSSARRSATKEKAGTELTEGRRAEDSVALPA